jgi:superfamily II DNA helicase RecQ
MQHTQLFVISPEQMFPHHGHLTFFGKEIRRNKSFRRTLQHIFFDEVHCIDSLGMAHNGVPPSRPAYGSPLKQLRFILPSGISLSGLSATLTRHSKAVAVQTLRLRPNFLEIRQTVNRPNLIYARVRLKGRPKAYDNMNWLVPLGFDEIYPEKILIFVDTEQEAQGVAHCMNSCFSPRMQYPPSAGHYHAGMSGKYLQNAHTKYEDPSPENRFKILVATKSAALVCLSVTSTLEFCFAKAGCRVLWYCTGYRLQESPKGFQARGY